MSRIEDIKTQVRNYSPGLDETQVRHAAEIIFIREGFVQRMAETKVLSPEWKDFSKRIVECEVVLARYGLV